MAEAMASAIALPEPDDLLEHPSDNNTLKRRQSEVSGDESSSKKRRTSFGKTSPPPLREKKEAEVVVSSAARPRSITPVKSENSNTRTSKAAGEEDSRDARRKSVTGKAPDEKQRSKRLFGALLGNLNRPSDRTSKRRAEIEQRKKAELQKQDDERLEDRQRRLERLAIQRKREQLKVDEQNMRIRHENLLSKANFLQTKAEPKLYYRPWDLLPDEEDLIEKQLKEAQEQIDRELVDWEDEQRQPPGSSEDSKEDLTTDHNEQPGQATDARSKVEEKTTDEEPATEQTLKEDPGSIRKVATSASDDRTERPAEVPDTQPSSPGPTNSVVKGQDTEQNGDSTQHDQDKEKGTDASESTEEPKATKDETETNGHAGNDKDELDEDGDHVVEGDEDNVIY